MGRGRGEEGTSQLHCETATSAPACISPLSPPQSSNAALLDGMNAAWPNGGSGWSKYIVSPVDQALSAQASGSSFAQGFESGVMGEAVSFASSKVRRGRAEGGLGRRGLCTPAARCPPCARLTPAGRRVRQHALPRRRLGRRLDLPQREMSHHCCHHCMRRTHACTASLPSPAAHGEGVAGPVPGRLQGRCLVPGARPGRPAGRRERACGRECRGVASMLPLAAAGPVPHRAGLQERRQERRGRVDAPRG